MSEMSKELIAQDAYEFANSNFGKWYLGMLKERSTTFLKQSKDIQLPHEQRVSAIDHVAGLEDAIEAIESRAREHNPHGAPIMR